MPTSPRAFLVHQDTLYVPDEHSAYLPNHTPITRLIEGICREFPSESRRILRERIYTRVALTPLCEGMIRLAAKRASVLDPAEYKNRFLNLSHLMVKLITTPRVLEQKLDNIPTHFSSLQEAACFAEGLKAHSDRAVGAILLDCELRTLAYAWNTNLEVRTQHAELNLIRSLEQKGVSHFPVNSKLLVTLKPCAMCAAAIHLFSDSDSSPHIFYGEDDPGTKAKSSVLMKGSELWLKAGKPEMRVTELKPPAEKTFHCAEGIV